MKITKGLIVSAVGSVVLGSLLIGSVAFAQNVTPTTPQGGQHGGPGGWGGRGGAGIGRIPAVFGTVSAVSGTTLTVTSKVPQRPNPAQGNTSGTTPVATTYTVDASSATVMKDNATSSVSTIAVGDTVMVQGTVSGTSVTAKTIRDGVVPMGKGPGQRPQSGPAIQGNGQPVVGGSVTVVNGSTLTIATAQGNVTYTVDASSATVNKSNATSSVSAIAVGDKVVVQGTVNGTSVTASTVIDSGAANASGSGPSGPRGGMGGILGAIGGFFQHLFGFF